MSSEKQSPAGGLLLIVNFDQVHEIGNFLKKVDQKFSKEHCIVVDDGSTDGSREIAEQMGYKVIKHEKNIGVGAAIRTGLEYGLKEGYRWVVISASNGKMLPEEFSRVYGPVDRGVADYVQGSRFLDGDFSPGLPLFRRLMIPAFSIFASILIGKRFTDITCGLRCYTFNLVKDPEINLNQKWLDRYELEYYLHFKAVRTKRYRIIEVPATMKYDQLKQGRTSKIQPILG